MKVSSHLTDHSGSGKHCLNYGHEWWQTRCKNMLRATQFSVTHRQVSANRRTLYNSCKTLSWPLKMPRPLRYQDISALIVDFTSAFNTTDHQHHWPHAHDYVWSKVPNRCHWHSQGFVPGRKHKNPAPIWRKHPSHSCGERQHTRRCVISFLFLLYMEPLLRWLLVGGRGYNHKCLGSHHDAPSMISCIKEKHKQQP